MACSYCFKSVTVEPVLFLYMFSIYMQYGIFQDLVYEKVCITSFNETVCKNLHDPNNSKCLDSVQKDSSMWILGSTVSLAIPSIITANFLGSWGDTFGRKLPLMMPSVGGILSSLVYVWMSLYNLSGPVWPIVIASAMSGMSGGFVSCIMAVMSYVSSVSSQGNRTARVTLLEAMSFLGGTIGPFAGAGLLSLSNHAVVFASICLCHVLLILYVLFVVPQVVGNEPVEEKNTYCSLTHVRSTLKTCFKRRDGNKRASLVCFIICSLVIMTTTAGEMDVSYLYSKDEPLKWKYQTYMYYFGLKHALASITLILGTPVVKHFNISDHMICIIGIISKISGLILLGLSTTDTMMFLVPLAAMFNSFCTPALRSLLSKQVDTSELGKMYAFVASVENVCMLLGSIVFNSLYPVMRNLERGLIFQFAAVTQLIPLIIMMVKREEVSVTGKAAECRPPPLPAGHPCAACSPGAGPQPCWICTPHAGIYVISSPGVDTKICVAKLHRP